jgi:DNA-binding GntR family transcriptional regulator
VVEDAISYRFGTRTRFEQNLLDNMRMPSRSLLSTTVYGAPADIAEKLDIKPGEPIFVADMLGEADALPVHVARLHLPLERLPLAEDVFNRIPLNTRSAISLTAILAELGVASFRRKTSRIRCRLPLPQEARHLKMSPLEPVFELDVLNVDEHDMPVFHGLTCYCGSRVEFVLEY